MEDVTDPLAAAINAALEELARIEALRRAALFPRCERVENGARCLREAEHAGVCVLEVRDVK